KKYLPLNYISVMIGIGVFLRLAYILFTPVWCRQHDVIDFGTGIGHAGYIEYLFEHKALPDFDPREKWAFFQPPLHHIIAAIWMKINVRLGILYRQAQENVQVLSLFYTGCIMIFSYYIFKMSGLKKWGMRVACSIIVFSPVFILMSGSLNNDPLCIALQVAAIYFALKWYQQPSYLSIILLAFCIGASMMTKVSGGSVAPAVAALFLLRLMKADEEESWSVLHVLHHIKKYILQFLVFGVICIPIGLWFPIRNLIRYQIPLSYTPAVGEGLSQYSILRRIFDLRMNSVYPAMINNGDAYDEYNVFLGMIKSSLFGEYNFSVMTGLVTPFSVVLFLAAVVLALLAFGATLYFLFHKNSKMSVPDKWFFGIFYLSQLFVYFFFAFKQAYFSSQDIRYVAGILVPQSLFLGLLADRFHEDPTPKGKAVFTTIVICSQLFAICSTLIYFGIGLVRS
ncbi:MAG: phospholipid carrier-dependent glycosyltransferase, partial [Clostridia bacterium]|nr:phospholipid carrier-dependent glycosyltransferase [Clostridia bacterium]